MSQPSGHTVLSHFASLPQLYFNASEFPFGNFTPPKPSAAIQEFSFPKNSMLGKQSEACFERLLRTTTHYEMLAANVQVQGSEQTLGELDYILQQTETGDLLHVELACKFYLWDGTLGTLPWQQWIGPNRKDQLAEKLKKLSNRQFPLLFAPETQAALKNLNLDFGQITQQLCLKALLFLPKGHSAALPNNFQRCVKGYYINKAQWPAENIPGALFALPNKAEWLLPPASLNTWHTYTEAEKLVSEKMARQRSPLVYRKLGDDITTFFVVWW